jgi:hypothetical protein
VKNTAGRPRLLVSADGPGIVSHAGSVLVTRTARVTGLDGGPSAGLARLRAPRAVHDPGKIVTDLAVALGNGWVVSTSASPTSNTPTYITTIASITAAGAVKGRTGAGSGTEAGWVMPVKGYQIQS